MPQLMLSTGGDHQNGVTPRRSAQRGLQLAAAVAAAAAYPCGTSSHHVWRLVGHAACTDYCIDIMILIWCTGCRAWPPQCASSGGSSAYRDSDAEASHALLLWLCSITQSQPPVEVFQLKFKIQLKLQSTQALCYVSTTTTLSGHLLAAPVCTAHKDAVHLSTPAQS
jgi:hypothetical protein